MSRFFQNKTLTPYTPGEQPKDRRFIKLNTNESPFPPSPIVLDAVSREETGRLNLYPDPTAGLLVNEIARAYNLGPSQVAVGNGSDELLAFAFLAFCDKNTGAAFADITYGFYEVWADLFRIDALKMPLDDDFALNVKLYAGLKRTIFIANPNAPTGLCLPLADIETILKGNPDNVIVVDEAYIDFGGESAAKLLPMYDNLLIISTFSKSRNLAGMRIGYALGGKELIADLNTVKYSFNPYSLDRLAILAGAAAVRDADYFKSCTEKIILEREKAKKALENMGFFVTDSKTNFLFAKHDRIHASELYSLLREKGILVRHFNTNKIDNFLRVTIGSSNEMKIFIEKMEEILNEDG